MAATTPPTIIQTALFVGEPVNVRETSELKECEACNPKINKTIPPTNNANPIALFMVPFDLLRP
ncbi:MAG: hypothetical protein JWQ71_4232 [Pedosphaera sp.]|nr:hypothetical protein [Pedosphaera sp.]